METDRGDEKDIDAKISIKEVMAERDVLFVHGIHATHWTRGNSLLNARASWKDKLDIALNLKPVLSVSTIRPGEGTSYLWSRMGLLLIDGDIEAMFSGDAGTQAKGLGSREINENREQSSLNEALGRFGNKNGVGSIYNEIVVSEPKYAGFVIAIDGAEPDKSLAPTGEVLSECKKRGLPVFVLIRGLIYSLPADRGSEVIYCLREDAKRDKYKDENELRKWGVEPVNPKDLKIVTFDLEKTEEEKKRILSGGVFDIDKLSRENKEIDGVVAYGWGEKLYMDILMWKSNRRIQSDETLPQTVEEAKKLGHKELLRVSAGDTKIIYFECLINLGNRRVVAFENNPYNNRDQIDLGPRDYGVGHFSLGRSGLVSLGQGVSQPEDCVAAMLKAVNDLVKEWGERDNISDQFKFNLYGFGEAARLMGDEISKAQVEEVLNDDDQLRIEEIVKRRIGENGNIVLSESDL